MSSSDAATPDEARHAVDNGDLSDHGDASAEAAGAARGLSRSLGRTVGRSAARSASRFPVGKIPQRATTTTIVRRGPPRLRARQVAKVSDRLSTGYDWWSSAVESDGSKGKPSLWSRGAVFATSVVKNTLLGMLVFESYGYTIAMLAPTPNIAIVGDGAKGEQTLSSGGDFRVDDEQDDIDDDELVPGVLDDEYARASVAAHFLAGAVGGSAHGVAETVLERPLLFHRRLPLMTAHHGLAHAVLFGSYESFKRAMEDDCLSVAGDNQLGYLVSFTLAGGFAGQLQHVVSHYTEQILIPESSGSPAIGNRSSLVALLRRLSLPTLRPTLMAFLPGAIGFVAFEYGKHIST